MLDISYEPNFLKFIEKIKDSTTKERVKKQIAKVIQNPEIGKPMKYDRKGTRELYVSPYRLSYVYIQNKNKIVFLDLYHKDEQ